MIYATAVSFTKASIVMFYWRLFNLRWAIYACLFLVISYWFTIVITIITACQPLDYFWVSSAPACWRATLIVHLQFRHDILPQEQPATVSMYHSSSSPMAFGPCLSTCAYWSSQCPLVSGRPFPPPNHKYLPYPQSGSCRCREARKLPSEVSCCWVDCESDHPTITS